MDKKAKKDKPDIDKDISSSDIKKLRCINIDCVFNSSNNPEHTRNTCNHPKLSINSKYADITIAICSEFRSKKDYIFELPDKLIEKKSNTQVEIKDSPEPGITELEKVTTDELEKEYLRERETKSTEQAKTNPETEQKTEYSTPVVITPDNGINKVSEPHLTTDKKYSDFQILKRLYQPYMRRGITVSILFHIFAIWMIYAFIADKGKNPDVQQNQQRIVIVEDIDQPQKFDPPDVDKQKEIEKQTAEDLTKNNGEVRPKIHPKNIIPKIKRPKMQEIDTSNITKNTNFDSLKLKTDSLLAANKNDTNKLIIPDSLKNFMPDNEIGMKLWYPKNWKLRDNRDVNLNLQQFKGVILNTDSLSEDPGAVTIFIQIDDPKHSTYNKTTYKNIFAMDDSTVTAYSTDPQLTGASRISYKFFIFNDPTGNNNVFVNSEIKKDMFDKYKKYIEAIVRSVKIITKSPSTDIK